MEAVAARPKADLADLFFHEGGETRSRRVARAIVDFSDEDSADNGSGGAGFEALLGANATP